MQDKEDLQAESRTEASAGLSSLQSATRSHRLPLWISSRERPFEAYEEECAHRMADFEECLRLRALRSTAVKIASRVL